MVVTFPRLALQDGGDDGQSLVGGGSIPHGGIDLLLGGLLAHFHALLRALLLVLEGIAGDEVLAGLVGMELLGLFAVRLVQSVVRGRGLDAQQVVEGDVGAVMGDDFVTEAEDLVVWQRQGFG